MKHKGIIVLFFLILISFAFHIDWITGWSFGAGDWWYFFSDNIKNWPYKSIWVSANNFGNINLSLWRLPSELAYWIFNNSQLGDKIWAFFPYLIVSPISIFLFLRMYFKKNIAIFAGGIFFISNSYFLAINSQGHIPLAIAASFMIISFVYYKKFFETNSFIYIIFSVLALFLAGIYDFRFVYVGLIILCFYSIFYINKISVKVLLNVLVFFTLLILLNLFWFLPTYNTGLGSGIGRELFGSQFWSLLNAITTHYPFWPLNGKVEWFVVQPIPFFYWIFPALAFVGFFLGRQKKDVIFFMSLAVLGIFLSKMSNEPMGSIYNWLYNNLPGFNAFREPTKFFIITILAFSFLIALFFESIEKKIIKYFLFIFIFLCVLINLPIITDRDGGMYSKSEVPKEYNKVAKNFSEEMDFSRIIWIPYISRWSYYSNNHPRVINTSFSKSYLSEADKLNFDVTNIEQEVAIYKTQFSNRLFDISSIKYVIIPIQDIANDDDFFVSYGGKENPKIREQYISQLDQVDWLKKIDIGTEELVIYENENYRPHIYTTKEEETIHWEVPFEKVDFVQKNPTEYKISLKNLSKKTYLNFSESFHPDWKLRAGEFGWFSVLIQKDYFLPDDFHLKNNANLSTFKIDPEFIKKNYPNSYTENPDGSINVNLTLFFKPQSYFYLGLIISGTTLLSCLGYLLYDWRKRKKQHSLQNQ